MSRHGTIMVTLAAALAAVLAAALSGCNLAPPVRRGPLPVPSSLPQGPAYPAPAGQPGDVTAIGWHDFFTDRRLADTIALALANNRDLRASLAATAEARALYRSARAALLPTVIASGGPATSQGPSIGQSANWNASAGTTNWEIDLFGQLRNTSKAAQENWLASDEGRKAAELSLIAETADAWLTFAADRDALAIARDTVASRAQSLAVTRQLAGNGIGTALAVAQAETAAASAEADVARYTTALAQARNALDLLAGTPVPDALLPDGLGEGTQTLAQLPVGLSSQVLLARPDVRAAEHQLIAAHARIGVARAAFLPQISLTGLVALASPALETLAASGNIGTAASVTATQTLFDGGVLSANLAYARAARDAALAAYEKAIQSAFAEVANALARRGTISAELAADARNASSADTAARITHARYNAGVASYLEPLDADRTAYAARQTLVTARLARASNMVELYRALGGGLRP